MAVSHKNKFASEARHRLIDLRMSITDLASKIDRPRSTVSKAIHSTKFPIVRAQVAKKLGIKEGAA